MKRKLAKILVTENQVDNKFLIFFLAFDVRLALLLTHIIYVWCELLFEEK